MTMRKLLGDRTIIIVGRGSLLCMDPLFLGSDERAAAIVESRNGL